MRILAVFFEIFYIKRCFFVIYERIPITMFYSIIVNFYPYEFLIFIVFNAIFNGNCCACNGYRGHFLTIIKGIWVQYFNLI